MPNAESAGRTTGNGRTGATVERVGPNAASARESTVTEPTAIAPKTRTGPKRPRFTLNPPPYSRSAHVDVHKRAVVRRAGIESRATSQLRVFAFDPFHGL